MLNFQKFICCILLISIFSTKLNAQTIQWQNTIGGSNVEWTDFIENTRDGNHIIGGYSYSNISGDKTANSKGQGDFWLIKIDDTSGNLLWQKTIGGNNFDHLVSGSETQNGDYILGGYSSSAISGDKTESCRGMDDFWVVKLDANRNIIWDKTYGGSGVDRLEKVIETNDGGYLLGGFSDSNISGEKSENSKGDLDMWIIKVDQSGNIMWQKTLGGSGLDWLDSMIKTPDGGYILEGSSLSNISGNKTENSRGLGDYWIVKIDSSGNIVWQRTIGGDNGDYCNSIVATSDGNYMVSGFSASNISGEKNENRFGNSDDAWLIKIDGNGQILWQKTIGGNGSEHNPKIINTIDNGYVLIMISGSGISGYKTEALRGGSDYWIVKLDSSGTVQWDKDLGGSLYDDAKSIVQTNDGGYIGIGRSISNVSGDKTENSNGADDFWVVKLQVCAQNNTSISANGPICNGNNLELSATGGTTYSWTGPNNFVSTQQNPIIVNANASHSGLYSCLITGTGGCDGTTTVTVTFGQPIPTLTSPQTFCIQQNATLNDVIISGQNIKWYDALTAGNLLLTTPVLQNNATYYASQTIAGCESTRIPVAINIQNTPAPSGTSVQNFCANFNLTLSNLAVSGTSIIWYDSAVGGSVLPLSYPLADGMTYYASQTLNGCESPLRLGVTIMLISSLPSNNYAVSLCDNLNDGSEFVELTSYNANLIANPTSYTFTYYNTLIGAENQDTADAANSSFNPATGLNTIYVRITNSSGCASIVTLALTLVPSPIITMPDEYYLCKNSVLPITAPNGFETYTWSDGSINQSIIINQAGVYTLTVTKNHNTPSGIITCSTTKTFIVILSDAATILPFETNDWTSDNNIITVNVTGLDLGDYVYSLNGIDYQQSNVFYDLGNGEYTVYVKNKNDCGIKTADTYLLMYPKFFTPNGDSYNDYWKIKFSDNEPNLTVKIFDRYGKFIKQFGINSAGWDGTYEGLPAVSTDYWFVVTRQNGKEHQGHFTLKR
ncbi:T9SS type B sorting domain-containing protein [Flavobacterium sp. GT3R68]|uniref:T9SS type B sorting domain-containing protein n=1 Tax=Flavobacterium sp. GT3R68 TaxID=2594437 RepID=UPI000F86200C|nr:T9SS type B sorting domain-containing protein [Flavobacterium sp. GT3R68]RTY86619.1 T9SS type B sorting domain-containing protein [Flavobacterium sp. GSN2]TRW92346.1 T9SS type B sorting domain-containing protein [Flavobacterium sp. GT3R68]